MTVYAPYMPQIFVHACNCDSEQLVSRGAHGGIAQLVSEHCKACCAGPCWCCPIQLTVLAPPCRAACILLIRTPTSGQLGCFVWCCTDPQGTPTPASMSSLATLSSCSASAQSKDILCLNSIKRCRRVECLCHWALRCECGQPCNMAAAAAVGPLCQTGAGSRLHHAAHAGHGTLQVSAGPAWCPGLPASHLLRGAGLPAQIPG